MAEAQPPASSVPSAVAPTPAPAPFTNSQPPVAAIPSPVSSTPPAQVTEAQPSVASALNPVPQAQIPEAQPPVVAVSNAAPQTPAPAAQPTNSDAEAAVAVNKDKDIPNPAPPPTRLADLDTPGDVALGLNPAPQKPVADDSVNTAPAPVPAEPKPVTHPRQPRKLVAASTQPSSKVKPVVPKPVATSLQVPTPFMAATDPLEDKGSRPHFISNF